MKYFHRRNISLRRKSLEDMCKENYRIYFSLNGQQSSYKQLFEDKHSTKLRSKERINQSKMNKLPQKQQVAYFKTELRKINRLKDIFNDNSQNQDKTTPLPKKQGIRQILT
jgi:hypothetical protein